MPIRQGENPITENGLKVLRRRYLRRGPDGKPVETVEGLFQRVAHHVAAPDDFYGSAERAEESFYRLISELRFMPNSPTFTGAGTPLGQLAACFVLPIEDDMGSHADGIFQTLRNAALVQQTGGGNGFSFSRLRPKGALVATSAGKATGPIGFMHVYDKAFGEIAQGGSRRGANMAVLRVDHPDIEEFIGCKAEEGAIANFNISVGITDAFMQAVENDGDFDLVSPQDGVTWRTVRARDLFDKIVEHAHHNGEPGLLFLDEANRTNPVSHLYQIEATNPCGEQFLGPYESCCLGSINLSRHVTDEGTIDWERLRVTVEESTHFLDNVITANKFVPAVPQLKESAEQARRIGLGVMGLADVFYKTGVRYGSEEALALAGAIMEFVRYHCMRASIELAKARGPFPASKHSIYDPDVFQFEIPAPLVESEYKWGRPTPTQDDWRQLRKDLKRYGIRNAAQTTIAPTGTISTVSGVEGYGCEPVFALAYTRYVNDNGRELPLQYISPLFEQALVKAGIGEETRQRITKQVIERGTCQNIPDIPEDIRHTFVVSADIAPEEHVRMQAALQRFVDNSISKTCNFPASATREDVAHAYKLAWQLGCKGLTVYVTGSREKVVLETKATKEKKAKQGVDKTAHPVTQATQAALWRDEKKPRPSRLPGETTRIQTPVGSTYVTINRDADDQPFEVFIQSSKAGSETMAISEAIGRLISYILRLSSPVSPSQRLKEVVRQMEGIGGGRPLGFGNNRVLSLPDGIAQALATSFSSNGANDAAANVELPVAATQHTPLRFGDLCPECGEPSVVQEEGCSKCYSCGYSAC